MRASPASIPERDTPAAFASVWWISLALVAVSVFIYAPVATHEFVNYDDPQYVSANPHVLHGVTRQAVAWAFTTGYEANWHPVTWLSHMLDVQLYGINAGPHHLTNLFFHVLNTLLLFGVLDRMTRAPGKSGVVAALFAAHPLHVESVAWVAERKDVLSTCFWLLTMWAYVRFVRRRGTSRYLLVVALLALGLMAKPMLVTVPFVLLLLDVWPLERRLDPHLIWEKLPLMALAAASSVVTFLVQLQGGAVRSLPALPFGRRAANALVSYVAYIGQMIWPAGLAAIRPYPPSTPAWQWLVAFAMLSAASAVVIRARRHHPYLAVGWFWYLGTLVPVIGLIQVGTQPMADRYTYVPLIGLFIVAVWAVDGVLARWPSRRPLAAAAAVVLIASLATTARAQVEHWRNGVTLWQHDLAVTRGNYRAENNLGDALARQGQLDAAVSHYLAALHLKPDFAEAHDRLGVALERQGRIDDAAVHYAEAVRLNPHDAEAHNHLGAALAARGQTDEAIRHFSAILDVHPEFAAARTNLGVALMRRGEADEAIRAFAAALEIDPDNADAHNGLGVALADRGRLGDAMDHFAAALRVKPDFADAHDNLGNALVSQKRTAEAVAQYVEALRIRPDDPVAHNGLGAAFADQGKLDDAISQYAEAVRIDPRYAEAHNNLGRAFADRGRLNEALAECREAVRLRPSDPDFHYDVAVLLLRTGQRRAAVEHLRAAVRLDPHHAARRVLADLDRDRP